jgi:Leucine Rich repeat
VEFPSRVLLQFFSLPNTRQLTHFDFPSTDFTSEELDTLVTWRAIPGLRSMSFNPTRFLSAHVSRVEGIRSFLHRAPFERLERLELSTGIDDDLIDVLLRSPFAGQLTHLELGGDRITAEGLARLFHGNELHNLCELSLRDFELGAGWVEVFRRTNLPKLKSLSVMQSDVDDRAVVALSKSDLTRTIKKLVFHFNRISDDGAIRFATNPAFERLRELSLSANRIDRVGARALSRSHIGTRMTWGNLWGSPATSRREVFAPENNSQRPLSDWPFDF